MTLPTDGCLGGKFYSGCMSLGLIIAAKQKFICETKKLSRRRIESDFKRRVYAPRANFASPFNVVSSSFTAAAATFSSRCSMREVPGIGSITGERCRSHASASCEGVIFNLAAACSTEVPDLDTSPDARGNQGMNPMFALSQYSTTSSAARSTTL